MNDWLIAQAVTTADAESGQARVMAAKPHTLQEAVDIILLTFDGEDFRAWANSKKPRFNLHFELGMWIRNQWAYGESSPLYQRTLNLDPDRFSSVVLKALECALDGKPLPVFEEELAGEPYLKWRLVWDDECKGGESANA